MMVETGLSNRLSCSKELFFLGGRKYIHSSTIYDTILDGVKYLSFGEVSGQIKLNIRARSSTNLLFHMAENIEDLPPQKAPVVTFMVKTSKAMLYGWAEATDEAVTKSMPYDEDFLLSHAEIVGDIIRIKGRPPFEPIKVASSIAHRLHREKFTLPTGHKWFSVAIDLDRPLTESDMDSMSARLGSSLSHVMSRSFLSVNGGDIGRLTFSASRYDP
jgi:hypothetical protein